MRAIGWWLTGMGFLHLARAVDRALVAALPPDDRYVDPPLWSIGLMIASGGVHHLVGRSVREGKPLARFVGALLVAAYAATTLAAINKMTIATGAPAGHYAETSHLAAALRGEFLGLGWPEVLARGADFAKPPTGLWGAPEIVVASAIVALAAASVAFLAFPLRSPVPAGRTEGPFDLEAVRRRIAEFRAAARPSIARRALNSALIFHVVANGLWELVVFFDLLRAALGRL